MRAKGFVRLDGALAQAMEQLQLDPVLREARAIALWPEIVGPQVAGATRVESVRDGVVCVVARSPAWAFELTFHKPRLLRELNSRLGRGTVRDLRFRVGSPQEPQQALREPVPDAAALDRMPLPEDAAAAIEAAVADLPDPDLRARLAAALATDRRREVWLRAHGYRSCAHCGALHSRPTPDCPACRRDAREREGGRACKRAPGVEGAARKPPVLDEA